MASKLWGNETFANTNMLRLRSAKNALINELSDFLDSSRVTILKVPN